MARASYVYLIIERYSEKILAGFTVKYEAYNWVETNHWMHHALKLMRMPDGGDKPPVEVDWEVKEIERARARRLPANAVPRFESDGAVLPVDGSQNLL